ncbi:MAG TPA: hypothetical protein VFF30_03330 [Nitrososphaerales archaeon]|nr:hypothetical protein [Nitrososphaerales archaeon]
MIKNTNLFDPSLTTNQSQDINQSGTTGSYDVQTEPGHLYFFHVNGVISQFWSYNYSAVGADRRSDCYAKPH